VLDTVADRTHRGRDQPIGRGLAAEQRAGEAAKERQVFA
jgi:hypothetical protein